MRYLLDSDILSEFYEPSSAGHSNVAAKLSSFKDSDTVAISILTIYEFEYGCAKAPDDKKPEISKRIDAAQRDFEILALSTQAARIYGNLKKELVEARRLDKKRSRVHNIDVMIAASAIHEAWTLVSADAVYAELQKLNAALALENWLAP